MYLINLFYNKIKMLWMKFLQIIKRESLIDMDEPPNTYQINYDEEIKKRNEYIRQFERVVGDTPIKQIDWINKHGFNRFVEWNNRCEKGLKMYDRPLIICAEIIPKGYEGMWTLKGGLGNKVILQGCYEGSIEEKEDIQKEINNHIVYSLPENKFHRNIKGVGQDSADYVEIVSTLTDIIVE